MNKKIFLVVFVIVIIVVSLIILRKEINENKIQLSNADNLSNYQGTYIGDNSSVNNILLLLPYSENKKNISLQTSTEPYGLTVTYNMDGNKEMMKYNSDKLFELIKNLGEITYIFNNQQVKIERNENY